MLNPIGRGWLIWIATLCSLFATFAVLVPFVRHLPDSLRSQFDFLSQVQRTLCNFAVTLLAFYLLNRLLNPKWNHLKYIRKHPPIWLAWSIAGILLFLYDQIFGLGPSDIQAEIWEWMIYGIIPILVLILYHWLVIPKSSLMESPIITQTSLTELAENWTRMETWLIRDTPADEDLLGNVRAARNLFEYLSAGDGTIGLRGAYGSGKSSIIRWIKGYVQGQTTENATHIWFCEQSCWAFQDSASAVHDILQKATHRIGLEVDCFSIRSLPEDYRKTFSAGGDWLRTLADTIIGAPDVESQLTHLSDILQVVNARLVIIVEDLDRTDAGKFNRQEVLALLQKLRNTKRVSFILATGQTPERDIDFDKLCDRIESLGDIDSQQIAAVIDLVRTRCLSAYYCDHLLLPQDNPWDRSVGFLMERYNHITLSSAVANLLRTPRALKHALRRTYTAWVTIHGEVDFDHLLAINILRYGAPEAFEFLERYRRRFVDDPRSWTTDQLRLSAIHERFQSEWQQIADRAEWNPQSARAILDFLIPSIGEYLGNRVDSGSSRVQGISRDRCWNRLRNEQLEQEHARDQDVLRDLRQWVTGRDPCSTFVERLCQEPDYAFIFEEFAPRALIPNSDIILTLSEQVFGRFRNPSGARPVNTLPNPWFDNARMPHSTFLVLWRYAFRHVEKSPQTRQWLEVQIRLAFPESLALVNDLYYYWASPRNGIVTADGRTDLRKVIFQLAEQHILSGDVLLRISHPEISYGLYQLVFPPDSDGPDSLLRGVTHWSWIGPLVSEALVCQPRSFAIEVAHLISGDRRILDRGGILYEANESHLFGFFESNAQLIVDQLVLALDLLSGQDRSYLDQIIRSAQTIIDQRNMNRSIV